MPDASPPLEYQHLQEEDIHELIYFRSDHQTMEIAMEHIYRLYEKATGDMKVRLLLDFRISGMMPLKSVISEGRQWSKRVKVHPQVRLALLTHPDAVTSLVTPIFGLMRFSHLQVRMFHGETRLAAVDWLKQS